VCLQDDCQNYIRVLAKIAENRVLICGTNAYKPLCRHYHFKVSPPVLLSETVGWKQAQ
jgi:semaphorin 6